MRINNIIRLGCKRIDKSIEAVIARIETEIEDEKSLSIKVKEDADRDGALRQQIALDGWIMRESRFRPLTFKEQLCGPQGCAGSRNSGLFGGMAGIIFG